jgi:hypothetical protein
VKVTSPHRVRVVVDSSFGERLASLPSGEAVWVVDSPQNTPVAHRLWKQRPSANHLTSITTFKPGSSFSPEQELLSQLATIDLHHGELSADPPYSILEIVGCPQSASVSTALSEFGFVVQATTPDGFIAVRTHEA